MKFTTVIQLLAAAAGAMAQLSAEQICGNLGVLSLSAEKLATIETKDMGALRLCANHPLDRNRTLDPAEGASLAPSVRGQARDTSLNDRSGSLSERSCYTAAQYGCSGGYCWKQCGDKVKGEWCWTANVGGVGSWRTCTKWQDCGTNDYTYGCGKNCLKPYQCGCSC